MFTVLLLLLLRTLSPILVLTKQLFILWWPSLHELGSILTVYLVLLSQQGGIAVFLFPQNWQCLTAEWNCCLVFIVHVTDLMWWVVISLKRCVNFASQVEQDTVHSAWFSSSAVSDGTQSLPCVSPSGPPQGRGWEGSQWGSWASSLHLSCLNQSCSHLMSFASWHFFFPGVLFATEWIRWVWIHGVRR